MLETRNLTVKRGGRICLSNVNLHFTKKEGVIGLIGPNGAGKTTLIDCLLGNLRSVNGSSIRVLANHVGHVTDVPSLPASLRINEAIEYTAILKRVSSPNVPELLHRVGLSSEVLGATKTVGELSRGLRQRLAIACALVGDPELLILDEPTSALDPMGREEVLSLIFSEGARRLVLVSSHLLSDIESISNDLIVLNNGEVLFSGPKSELLNSSQNVSLCVSVKINHEQINQFIESLRVSGIKYVVNGAKEISDDGPRSNPDSQQNTLKFIISSRDEQKLFKLFAEWEPPSTVEIHAASQGLPDVFRKLMQDKNSDA